MGELGMGMEDQNVEQRFLYIMQRVDRVHSSLSGTFSRGAFGASGVRAACVGRVGTGPHGAAVCPSEILRSPPGRRGCDGV